MKLEVVVDVAAAVGQVASALFAIPAFVIAFFAWRTSRSAERAATALTTIEKSRWYAEFHPQFEGHLINLAGKDEQPRHVLTLKLVGPPLLHELDKMSVYIRADERWDKVAQEFVEDRRTFRFVDASFAEQPGRTSAVVKAVRRDTTRSFGLEAVRDLRPAARQRSSVSASLYITCTLRQDYWVVPVHVMEEDL